LTIAVGPEVLGAHVDEQSTGEATRPAPEGRRRGHSRRSSSLAPGDGEGAGLGGVVQDRDDDLVEEVDGPSG
jgi:hypothetical protein